MKCNPRHGTCPTSNSINMGIHFYNGCPYSIRYTHIYMCSNFLNNIYIFFFTMWRFTSILLLYIYIYIYSPLLHISSLCLFYTYISLNSLGCFLLGSFFNPSTFSSRFTRIEYSVRASCVGLSFLSIN